MCSPNNPTWFLQSHTRPGLIHFWATLSACKKLAHPDGIGWKKQGNMSTWRTIVCQWNSCVNFNTVCWNQASLPACWQDSIWRTDLLSYYGILRHAMIYSPFSRHWAIGHWTDYLQEHMWLESDLSRKESIPQSKQVWASDIYIKTEDVKKYNWEPWS